MGKRLHRGLVAALLAIDIALVAAFAVFGDRDRLLDNAIDIWFDLSDPTLPAYRAEQETFGESSWIYVNLWADDPGAASAGLTPAFRRLDGVISVLSPHDIDVLQEDDEGLFFDVLWPDVPWEDRHDTLSGHPIAATTLASPGDPSRVGFLLEEGTGVGSGGTDRQRLIGEIRALIDATPGVTASAVTGSAVINAELNRLSWRDILILLPVTGGIVLLIGVALFRRNAGALVVIIGTVGVVVLASTCAMLLAGHPFNMVTIALPGILFTLGTASGLHVCQYVATHGDTPPEALAAGLARPLGVSHLTTGLGFGLLATITVLPVQTMALWGGLGVAWSGLHMGLVLPLLLTRTPGALALPGFASPRWLPRMLGWGDSLRARPLLTLAVGAVIALGLGTGIARLNVDSTYLNMVAEDERMRSDYALLEQRGIPSAQIDIVLTSDRTDGQVPPELNDAIRSLGDRLTGLPGVHKVIGPGQIYAETAPRLRDELTPEAYDSDISRVTDTYVFALTGGNREVGRYLDYDLRRFRIVVMFDYMPNSQLHRLVSEDIRPAVDEITAPLAGVTARVSGLTLLWANMDRAIARGQITSLSMLAGICFLLFLVSTRRPGLSALATAVNLMPVAVIAATLGHLGLPIDMATIFILALLLGIAVDDTSFYLHAHLRHEARGGTLLDTLTEVTPAMLVTSILITAGFAVLLVSSFVPIQTFGLFTALGILCATAADVVVLSLLLMLFQSKGHRT